LTPPDTSSPAAVSASPIPLISLPKSPNNFPKSLSVFEIASLTCWSFRSGFTDAVTAFTSASKTAFAPFAVTGIGPPPKLNACPGENCELNSNSASAVGAVAPAPAGTAPGAAAGVAVLVAILSLSSSEGLAALKTMPCPYI
jgi:hypothetical protein